MTKILLFNSHYLKKKETKQIISNKEKTCLSTNGRDLTLVTCDGNSEDQKWTWKELYI